MDDFPELSVPRRLGPSAPKTSMPVKLGTANWENFEGQEVPVFRRGDFWLSYLPDGTAIGARDDRHVLVVGGTRGGKGTSFVIPNLLLWQGSTVVIDPKGENAMITARRRAHGSEYAKGMGQKTVILDPFDIVETFDDDFADLKGGFNPMDILNPANEQCVDDAWRIADALVIESSTDPFFTDAARHLLQALVLHVATWRGYTDEHRNLVTVRELLTAGDQEAVRIVAKEGNPSPSGMRLLFESMRDNDCFGGIVANAGVHYLDLLDESPRTYMSIVQTACTNTDFIDSPGMARCLTRSDFSMHELKTRKDGLSLFLCLPQRMMATHSRWLRLMTTLTLTEMERWQFQPESGYPVLLMMDEFPALQRMRVIENAAAQIAGFGVKMVFVVQTLAQLKEIYKDNWETLVACCGTKIFLNVDDHFSRDYVSKLVGNIEVRPKARSSSETFGKSDSFSTSVSSGTSFTSSTGANGAPTSSTTSTTSRSSSQSTSYNESFTTGRSESVQARLLLTPDEVGRLFGGFINPQALCVKSGAQPLILRRSMYYSDPLFRGYFDGHPDHDKPIPLSEMRDHLRQERDRHKNEFAMLDEEMRKVFIRMADEAQARREEKLRAEAAAHALVMWQRKLTERAIIWGIPALLLFLLILSARR